MKNPQTTFALTFLTHIIAKVGGVNGLDLSIKACKCPSMDDLICIKKRKKEVHPIME